MTTDATVETPASHGEPPRHSSPLLARHGAVRASGPDDGVAWHYGDPTAEQRAAVPRRLAVPDGLCGGVDGRVGGHEASSSVRASTRARRPEA